MKAIIETLLARRITDQWGQGHFGAPRGSRQHNGQDYVCPPGSTVLSPVSGEVTKLGFPYADDLSFRYVQITDSRGVDHRVFYVDPEVLAGQIVCIDSPIGKSQDLDKRYPGITQHVHYEIRRGEEYINPEAGS